jgi:hypothetical protein
VWIPSDDSTTYGRIDWAAPGRHDSVIDEDDRSNRYKRIKNSENTDSSCRHQQQSCIRLPPSDFDYDRVTLATATFWLWSASNWFRNANKGLPLNRENTVLSNCDEKCHEVLPMHHDVAHPAMCCNDKFEPC